MTLSRLNRPLNQWPFQQFGQLRDELDRFFASTTPTQPRNGFFNTWAPAVDLFENRDEFVVLVEVPGMKKEDIEISLHDGALTISGERHFGRAENGVENSYRTERLSGRFQRSITLPARVQGEHVKATYTDGVLRVVLPKSEEAKPRQIEVSVK
jgi:HSP20 family protein